MGGEAHRAVLLGVGDRRPSGHSHAPQAPGLLPGVRGLHLREGGSAVSCGDRLRSVSTPPVPTHPLFRPCPLALLLPLPTPSTPQAYRPGAGLTPASVGASTWPRGLSPPGPSDSSHRCGPHIILQTQSPWPALAFLRGFLTQPVTQGSWTLPELKSPHGCPSRPALSS